MAQNCLYHLQTNRTMKPNFLMYFSLIVVSAMIFALVYVLFTDVVEAYAQAFSISFACILMVGMYGMMDNIVSHTTHDKIRDYE